MRWWLVWATQIVTIALGVGMVLSGDSALEQIAPVVPLVGVAVGLAAAASGLER
jgi:hypothetical protein